MAITLGVLQQTSDQPNVIVASVLLNSDAILPNPIVIWVVAQKKATVTSTVTVRATESDPNPANNSASVTTTFR